MYNVDFLLHGTHLDQLWLTHLTFWYEETAFPLQNNVLSLLL